MSTGKTVFLYGQWLRLPINIRHQIAVDFGIKKKRSTHVANNAVVDDGYEIQDVEGALSMEKIQEYLDTNESDPNLLWDYLIARAQLSKKEVDLLEQCKNIESSLVVTFNRNRQDGRVFVGTNLFDSSGNREEFCLNTVEEALEVLLVELKDKDCTLSTVYPALEPAIPIYDTRFLSEADKATIVQEPIGDKIDASKLDNGFTATNTKEPIIKEVKRRGRPSQHDKTNK